MNVNSFNFRKHELSLIAFSVHIDVKDGNGRGYTGWRHNLLYFSKKKEKK